MNIERVLAIGAHYDDVELGCGGAAAKWADQGKEVYKITLTDNVTNFDKKGIHVDHDSSKKESAEACKALGIQEISDFPVEPCTELQFNKKQMQLMESIVIEKNIDTVVIHNIHDIQQDHVHAASISYVAGRYCKNILMYQSNRYVLPQPFYPRVFVDITDYIEQKKNALNQYGYAHNRYKSLFEMTIKQNRVYGYSAQMVEDELYAEGFYPIKMVL